MKTQSEDRTDLLVAGGGVIGLACAWRAARQGLSVRVVERADSLAAGASGVAAGMLAPVSEASWGEQALLDLGLASIGLWPDFAAELEADAGARAGYRRCGALHVALDRDEAAELRRHHELHRRLELDSAWLRPSEARRLEPALAPRLTGAVHAPEDGVADPVELCAALADAIRSLGGQVDLGAEIEGASLDGGVELSLVDGRRVRGERLVLATGCWSGSAGWLPVGLRPPVRPVKGEILTLRGDPADPVCERIVAGERVYIVPRPDGRVLVGATVLERGFDDVVTAGGVHELLREAYRVLPEVAELELLEARAGLRPGTPDNAPVIDAPGDHPAVVIATGHYRNGVLLAPVTAESVAALLAGEAPPIDLGPFRLARFASAPRAARNEAVAR